MAPLEKRLIFHITHVDNLASIIQSGCLWSDRRVAGMHGERVVIGFETIKRRRLDELRVGCHLGTRVGDYVPFYFCPRSPMLYVIHQRNDELVYRGGQERVVHLVSSVVVAVEAAKGRPWAFSDGNAGAVYTQYSADLTRLESFVDWDAVLANRWSGSGVDPATKNRKQAEFLVHDHFPWTGIQGIGVLNEAIASEVRSILAVVDHKPHVAVRPDWYY